MYEKHCIAVSIDTEVKTRHNLILIMMLIRIGKGMLL
jgi:hypothetical protein